MKAIRRSPLGVDVTEMPEPGKPGRGKIAIKVHAASINRADYAKKAPRNGVIAGSDVAGIIEAIGEGVEGFAVGDRVCAVAENLQGGLAETAIANARWTAHLPAQMSFAEGAALPSAGVTALAAVRKSQAGAASHVLICGASGGVGQYATALAKATGATVTAACSARNETVARAAGADAFVDYANGLDGIAPGSFDAMLAVNGSFPISICSRILKPKGAYVLVGADSLQPAALTVPLRGRRLKAATFFSLIGKDGLQQTVDEVARCGFIPSMALVHGFEEAASTLQALEHTHPQGKIVAVFEQ